MAVRVRRISPAMTSRYLIMNDAIAVNTIGTRSFRSPAMISLTSVVAASSTEAAAPRVAFTRMFHAPSSPAAGQSQEAEFDPRALADEWQQKREQHETARRSDSRVRKKRGGISAIPTSDTTMAA